MTFEEVKTVLSAMYDAKPIPSAILQIAGEQVNSYQVKQTHYNQDKDIRQWFTDIIVQQYNRTRALHRLSPITKSMPIQQIVDYVREDYQQSDRVLEAWSVMFVRYAGFVKRLSMSEHARIVQISERTLRRRETYGHKLIHLHILLH